MILVEHKELVFLNREQYLGAVGDKNAANRLFRIKRVNVDGVDLADLSFRLNAELPDGTPDTAYLEKEVREEEILLTWAVSDKMVSQPGTAWINLRAHDDTGAVKWRSFRAAVYIEGTTAEPSGPQLSEVEQLERAIDKKLESVNTAEEARKKAEKEREQAEADRVEADQAREEKTDAAIKTFEGQIEDARQYADKAKSYAIGQTGTRPGEDSDNAKEYCRQSNIHKGAAESAKEQAEAARDDLIKRIDSGEFTGPQGPPGPRGEKGESGINIPAASVMYVYTDSADNCAIHCVYDDAVHAAPPIKYRESDGALFWQYDDGQ